MSVSIGIDAGSVAVKVVVLADGRPTRWTEQPTRPDVTSQCTALLKDMAEPDAICATGYGRGAVREADSRISEIMANAFGAGWLEQNWPSLGEVFGSPPRPERLSGRLRTIVDVGGQDSKIITFDGEGMVRDFAMNDRCAAGTGRFLEVMARVLEVDLPGLDRLCVGVERAAPISSTCTVFAESEIISLLSDGVGRGQVAAGALRSVAQQVSALAARCAWEAPILFDGGLSRSRALSKALEREFGAPMCVAPCGQFATALGAALTAARTRAATP
ncbi:MAG: hypothetical protein J7M08_07310 [Planctomycetes bacterium]|nr:hypothetical protein [Planctomycetota bacterium]